MPAKITLQMVGCRGRGLQTRCKYVPVSSAPAIPGGRRSANHVPDNQPAVLCHVRRHGLQALALTRAPSPPPMAQRTSSSPACGDQRSPPAWVFGGYPLHEAGGWGEADLDRLPPRMAAAEPTGMYLWRVQICFTPPSSRHTASNPKPPRPQSSLGAARPSGL